VFLDKFATTLRKKPLRLSLEAMSAMEAYQWPGNIRELENCVERLVNVAQGDSIDICDLPQDIVTNNVQRPFKKADGDSMSLKGFQKEIILETLRKTQGNLRRASSILNISRTTLYAKIKKYCIEVDTFRSQ